MTKDTKKCSCGKDCDCGKDCTCGKDCKCDKCKSCGAVSFSIVPVCILVSMLTAVLVTLVFAISFVQSFRLELKPSITYTGAFAEATKNATIDENDAVIIGAEAVVNFFETEQTGFILATNKDCTGTCSELASRIRHMNNLENPFVVYRFNYDESAPNKKAQADAANIVFNGSNAPVLLFVRNGRIYDRLDDVDGETGLRTFIEKYR